MVPGFSQTIISGGNVSGVWDVSGSPYLISGDITIEADQSLSIQPGVYVVFQDSYFFQVIGQLLAIGNKLDSIYFTVQDTTGYNIGQHNGWYGLTFNGTTPTQMPESSINYCNFEYSLGSGITCLDYSELIINSSSFRENQYYGIHLMSFSNITINDISIYGNSEGGFSINNSTVELNGFSIHDNTGSGISLSGNSNTGNASVITNGRIIGNTATYYGGGISVMNDAVLDCGKVEIISNSAPIGGGGVYCGIASGSFSAMVINENASGLGGGVYGDAYSDFDFDHSIIAGNFASTDGAGLYLVDTYMDFENVTIANNTAQNDGGGVFASCYAGWVPTLVNMIIWDNYPESIITEGSLPEINFSDIEGGFSGNKNIDSDPFFTDPASYDYNLQWGNYPESGGEKSACIDSGDPQLQSDPDGTTSDMGALFFDQGSFTAIENKGLDKIYIYPNPAKNTIYVSGIGDYKSIRVSGLSGVVAEYQNANENILQIDLDNLKPGLYFLQVFNSNGGFIVEKFIKK